MQKRLWIFVLAVLISLGGTPGLSHAQCASTPGLLFGGKATGIDGTTAGSVLLFTTPSDKRFYLTHVIFEVVEVSGFVGTPSISVGWDSPNFINGLHNTGLIGLDTPGRMITVPVAETAIPSVPPGTSVYAFIHTPASGTVYKLSVAAIGLTAVP